MKRFIFLLVAFMPYVVFGQKAKIEFEQISHNFGTINENEGKVTHHFVFKNTGTAPLILTNVRAGCGCTTPEWNRQPVAPGSTGTIKVTFDPLHRPGSFVKSVTVNSNTETPVISLTIRGNVKRKAAGPYDAYKYSIGKLKLQNNTVNFGALKNTQKMTKTLEVINSDNENITINLTTEAPDLKISVTPSTLSKDQKGIIRIEYDAQKKNDWGFVSDPIQVRVNDKDQGIINVVSSISEDFSHYKGNYETAPVLQFSETETELKDLSRNSSYNHEFYIQNNGKSDLIIRKIKTSDANVSANIAKTVVKPGKKIKVIATIKTGTLPKVTKLLQFTTNDPKNPIVSYKIFASIK